MIKKIVLYFTVLILLGSQLFSQNSWTQRSNLPGPGRFDASGFVIGNYAYITCGDTLNTGIDYLNDLWQWDQLNDTWTQKADFPGISRRGCFSFALGANGYLGGGYNFSTPNLIDFWEYSSSNNVWSQKMNYPGNQNNSTTGFSINQFGYIIFAGGDSVLYKYDPANDNWIQLNNLPFHARNGSAVFVIDNNAYIGIGSWESDFWKFDAISENWVQVSDYPGPKRTAASAFSINGYGYVGCGFDTFGSYQSTFYAYDTLNNLWNMIAIFPAGGVTQSVGFSINGKGYVCTGAPPFPPAAKYLWEYSPIVGVSESITKKSISVFPNPFSTFLNISFDNPNHAEQYFTLYNSSGKLMKYLAFNQSKIIVETKSLADGIYFYKISNQSNIVIDSGKLIKNNF